MKCAVNSTVLTFSVRCTRASYWFCLVLFCDHVHVIAVALEQAITLIDWHQLLLCDLWLSVSGVGIAVALGPSRMAQRPYAEFIDTVCIGILCACTCNFRSQVAPVLRHIPLCRDVLLFPRLRQLSAIRHHLSGFWIVFSYFTTHVAVGRNFCARYFWLAIRRNKSRTRWSNQSGISPPFFLPPVRARPTTAETLRQLQIGMCHADCVPYTTLSMKNYFCLLFIERTRMPSTSLGRKLVMVIECDPFKGPRINGAPGSRTKRKKCQLSISVID